MRPFVEPSPFEKKTAAPKKSEAEMIGEFMGEKAQKEFERKFGKGVVTVQEEFVLNPREKEGKDPLYERAIGILGRENVHGKEDVEFLLDRKLVRVPRIPYSEKELLLSKEIKERTGVEEMLVLYVPYASGPQLVEMIQERYDELDLGRFLEKWHKDDDFDKKSVSYEWKLITKTCIPDSKGKYHDHKPGDDYAPEDTQEFAIEQYTQSIGVDRPMFTRPKPLAMLYALALHLTATEKLNGRGRGERLLKNEFHWSDRSLSADTFGYVGRAIESGANGTEVSRHFLGRFLGVCLAREPLSRP